MAIRTETEADGKGLNLEAPKIGTDLKSKETTSDGNPDDLMDSISFEPSQKARLLRHLNSPIESTYLAELELCILTFCTGIQDATTFPDYHCFASNQTGNTVLLAVSVCVPQLSGTLFVPANVGVSLGLFLAGLVVTGQLSHHLVDARSRPWLLFCNLVQTILVFGAATVQFIHGVQEEGPYALATLCLLAFASGSQVVQSRSLDMREISTAMATAAWVDLVIDPKVLQASNRGRNRRMSFLLALVAGSFVGAITYRKAGSAWAILISAIGKLLVTVMFLFNRSADRELDQKIQRC